MRPTVSAGSFRSIASTSAPLRAASRASPRPTPVAAPVTTAPRPSSAPSDPSDRNVIERVQEHAAHALDGTGDSVWEPTVGEFLQKDLHLQPGQVGAKAIVRAARPPRRTDVGWDDGRCRSGGGR